jgi:5-methylthioadenosine/S-adenosylhomocysteine deaminase
MALAVTNATLDGERVGLRAADHLVAAVGPDVSPEPGDETIDAAGLALVPALLNGHTHAAMTLFRGYGDDMPLMEWLERRIWPVEARLEPEDVYWGTRLACLEMIRSGSTRFWDMYWHPEATARAVSDAGLTAVIGAPLIDRGSDDGPSSLRAAALACLETLGGHDDRVEAALAPHAIYTVSEQSLRWVAGLAAERDLPVHIHVSETRDEVANCVREHGDRPAEYLDRVGLLGPRTVLAHGVWLDDAELDLIAARGATLVTNPVANLKLAVGGVFPYPRARERRIAVALGTDGAGSNNSLDLLADAKFFALAQKHAAGDPAVVTAAETLEIATGARAPVLGAGGRIAHGERADFLLVRADAVELTPGDLTANLVYAGTGAVVDTTVAGGRILMRGGAIPGADEVRAAAVERARRLGTVSVRRRGKELR